MLCYDHMEKIFHRNIFRSFNGNRVMHSVVCGLAVSTISEELQRLIPLSVVKTSRCRQNVNINALNWTKWWFFHTSPHHFNILTARSRTVLYTVWNPQYHCRPCNFPERWRNKLSLLSWKQPLKTRNVTFLALVDDKAHVTHNKLHVCSLCLMYICDVSEETL